MADIEKMENMAVDAEVEVEEKQPDEVVKTYTQTDVDNIVKSRLARERDKTKTVKAENAQLKENAKAFKVLEKILEEKGGFKGTPQEKVKSAAEYYGVSEEDVKKMFEDFEGEDKSDKQTIAYFNAKMFVEKSDPEEIEEEFDRINAIAPSQRTIKDKELLEVIKPKMLEKAYKDDKKWFESEIGGSFDELINSKDFKTFYEGTNMPVRIAVEKYVQLKGADNIKEAIDKGDITGTKPISTGSVKDSGASKLKEYYSPEDVDNLSDKDYDDPEIMKRVRESMTKWK